MLNWTSRRRDVLTLAHELGHGVHAALGGRQGIFHMATPLTLAETASVFGETIVFGRLLERAETPESRLSLLAESIEGSIATVFRQIAMNQFEARIHNERREHGELALDRIGELWAQSQEELLGDAVEVTDNYRSWWSYVHHFVSVPGYVYAYAYGQLLALAVYGRYEEEGEAFVPAYLKLLEAGGSRSPEELGKIVGIDLADPGFWDRGLALVERQLDAAEQAARDAGRALADQHRPRDDPRHRGELVDAHALVDRVGALEPAGADHHGRDAARAEEPHVGAVGNAGHPRGAALGADGGGHGAHPRMRRVGLAGRELAAGPRDLDRRRLAVFEDGLEGGAGVLERRAERDADPALDDDAVGDGARPLPALDPPDAERIGQREGLHRRVRDVAVDLPFVRLQREVRRQVAVERGAALEPRRRVGSSAAHGGPEGERAGLRADDVERGRLGDQAGVEGGVALERGERARARRPPPRRPPGARRSARARARPAGRAARAGRR